MGKSIVGYRPRISTDPLPPFFNQLTVTLLSLFLLIDAKKGLLGANKQKGMRQWKDIQGILKTHINTDQNPLLVLKKSGATDRIRTGDPWYHKPVL